jgi:hypothetical protein
VIAKASIGFQYDSSLPRDVVTITPHYNCDDPAALADWLKSQLNSQPYIVGKPFTIKVYDAKKAPPSYPLATVTNPGTPPTSGLPREVAICLSFYGTWNRPTYRGRLYLPASWFTSVSQVRPTGAIVTAALNFADVLGKNMPSGMFWTVYSRKKGTDAQVTDAWVDDEWDTVRSRGLRPTTRQTKTMV